MPNLPRLSSGQESIDYRRARFPLEVQNLPDKEAGGGVYEGEAKCCVKTHDCPVLVYNIHINKGEIMKILEMSGLRFGRLLVVSIDKLNKGKRIKWICQCDCGNETSVDGSKLRAKETRSCGCLQREEQSKRISKANLKHGHNRKGNQSDTHKSWTAMIQRCTNPNYTDYMNYGGRGIAVCERWRSFENFLVDMGERPKEKSIDRIQVNGNYEPSNCRWATRSEQQKNKRNNFEKWQKI
jgi:hypothetical protein